ncbi:aspartic peptidase domain-containing protein [Yarrowia lipolytica]|uniref:Aspartic peptidase domain-containing protein n=1 Tax=Yarrowia lipolytica TaxID=4952 RepID=A0A371C627_YARLL|nr:Candidapepsin [Yarrowia lipolytica]RDW25642.1 aspartic peptidase domain-containing protein [Yarrowia lipolytica]RDW33562.1 aspartic peptidase domain-containing protein [Yarrowia lipolytica]RDW41606.1 aspartic peptidase domain-containing protein [Yarrowia lipolytica]RDW44951.1 aspartic peptidase domain-containing protein [Yarrowia lipolytica]
MFFSTTLVASFLALVSAAPGNPKVLTFPVTKHHENSKFAQHHLLHNSRPDPLVITNQFTYYSINVGLGTPVQNFQLLLDTGSSDLWVYNVTDTADCAYQACQQTGQFDKSKSSTYHSLDEDYFIQYVLGNATGYWGTDTLSAGSVTLPNFQFACADNAEGQTGILGVSVAGSESLHKGQKPYANFPLALQNAGYIDRRVYSLYLDQNDATNGTFLLGGVDYAKFNGSLTVLPLATPNAFFVDYKSIAFDGEQVAEAGAAVLDSGTSFTYIPDAAYQKIAKKLNIGDNTFFGMTTVDCNKDFELEFNFDGVTIKALKEQMLIPSGLGDCFFGLQSNTLSQNITLFGDTFLRNAYVAYDLEDSQIGLAQAVYTDKTDIRPITGPLK